MREGYVRSDGCTEGEVSRSGHLLPSDRFNATNATIRGHRILIASNVGVSVVMGGIHRHGCRDWRLGNLKQCGCGGIENGRSGQQHRRCCRDIIYTERELLGQLVTCVAHTKQYAHSEHRKGITVCHNHGTTCAHSGAKHTHLHHL